MRCFIEDLLFPPHLLLTKRILNQRTHFSFFTVHDLALGISYRENCWYSAGILVECIAVHFWKGWIHLGFPVSLVFLFFLLFWKCSTRVMDRELEVPAWETENFLGPWSWFCFVDCSFRAKRVLEPIALFTFLLPLQKQSIEVNMILFFMPQNLGWERTYWNY